MAISSVIYVLVSLCGSSINISFFLYPVLPVFIPFITRFFFPTIIAIPLHLPSPSSPKIFRSHLPTFLPPLISPAPFFAIPPAPIFSSHSSFFPFCLPYSLPLSISSFLFSLFFTTHFHYSYFPSRVESQGYYFTHTSQKGASFGSSAVIKWPPPLLTPSIHGHIHSIRR